jgi:hypothetical protein
MLTHRGVQLFDTLTDAIGGCNRTMAFFGLARHSAIAANTLRTVQTMRNDA